jgi:hypothetical protein
MTRPGDSTFTVQRVRSHLERGGWVLSDEDERTALWRLEGAERLVVVLPTRDDLADARDRLEEAMRTIAFAESRSLSELRTDLGVEGGADTVSVRLTPERAPSGSAPLDLVQAAVTALHDFVVGSASALEVQSLVLPTRRPQRAELYVGQTLVSTAPGSFVINLALPLLETPGSGVETATSGEVQPTIVDVPRQPYGRRVTDRMRLVAEQAVSLAEAVGAGDRPLRAFAEPTRHAANATELAALATLGGGDRGRYQLRFAPAPAGQDIRSPQRLSVTPAQQRVFADAADFLRTKQPRSGVSVNGLVVRLARTGNFGRGEVVVQGESDDSRAQRRYRMELSEPDYNEAVRAHGEGLLVIATGDLEFAGTRASLRRLTGFSVIPGID